MFCPEILTSAITALSHFVIDNINGMKIRSMKDIPQALELKPEENST